MVSTNLVSFLQKLCVSRFALCNLFAVEIAVTVEEKETPGRRIT